ncbi:nuclear transport factor 2 family protein [Bradyrhizobium sp. 182]|nr:MULTISPECIES: nuclear transport factor 2 family protein [unclassified Bradyrhizobium]MCK1424046.1 nuclear transport factor 2 family protein [Bradyrhizobium sp. CW12]MCK1527130.1 nuclear transport factor 2 family protein [Bradyrhizobium sp. 182]MCK1597397.1 nuclear transport factor 2 family protein [Bradyrhizobium sp. 164]MCK1648164.1 nuclear transport factor 2 family protein [Bradyrhizobium sp. 154]MCK1668693.1 nuclear transport factor 2 family protein [Bradyrhizobium sp. 153]
MPNKLIRMIAATLSFITLALSPPAPSAAAGTESAAITSANHAFDEALSARDIAAMDMIWAHEPHVVAVHPASKTPIIGWAAVRQSWEATFDRFAEISVSMQDPQIRINENVAWVVGLEEIRGKLKTGEAATFMALTTNIFEMSGGRWLMVLHTTSRVPH